MGWEFGGESRSIWNCTTKFQNSNRNITKKRKNKQQKTPKTTQNCPWPCTLWFKVLIGKKIIWIRMQYSESENNFTYCEVSREKEHKKIDKHVNGCLGEEQFFSDVLLFSCSLLLGDLFIHNVSMSPSNAGWSPVVTCLLALHWLQVFTEMQFFSAELWYQLNSLGGQ